MKHGRKRYQQGCRCDTCKHAQQEHNREQRTCRRCDILMINAVPGRLCGFCIAEEAAGMSGRVRAGA